MKIEHKPSISIIKIICVSLILLALSGAGVIVMATQVNTVTITLPSGYELTVFTNKTMLFFDYFIFFQKFEYRICHFRILKKSQLIARFFNTHTFF